MSEQGVTGSWSVKDIIAHVTTWEEEALKHLPLILMANAGVVAVSGAAAPDAWRRVVHLILQGLEVPARGPLPAPPTREQMLRAMQRM